MKVKIDRSNEKLTIFLAFISLFIPEVNPLILFSKKNYNLLPQSGQ